MSKEEDYVEIPLDEETYKSAEECAKKRPDS